MVLKPDICSFGRNYANPKMKRQLQNPFALGGQAWNAGGPVSQQFSIRCANRQVDMAGQLNLVWPFDPT